MMTQNFDFDNEFLTNHWSIIIDVIIIVIVK